jgi:hypothetical protein
MIVQQVATEAGRIMALAVMVEGKHRTTTRPAAANIAHHAHMVLLVLLPCRIKLPRHKLVCMTYHRVFLLPPALLLLLLLPPPLLLPSG